MELPILLSGLSSVLIDCFLTQASLQPPQVHKSLLGHKASRIIISRTTQRLASTSPCPKSRREHPLSRRTANSSLRLQTRIGILSTFTKHIPTQLMLKPPTPLFWRSSIDLSLRLPFPSSHISLHHQRIIHRKS